MSISRLGPITIFAALLAAGHAAPIELHTVPIPAKSPRLLGMSMDEDGFIWLGSTHRLIYRYDPRTAATAEIRLPFDSSTSQCLCAGGKVYLLGQSYPKLMIYERATGRFREAAYPSPKPDVWYGTEAIEGRYLYLFDRGAAGVIKWDTRTDTGVVIPYPYETLLPSGGRYVAADGAIWCIVWDYSRGLYEPIGIARLEVKTDRFTGFFAFPKRRRHRTAHRPRGDALLPAHAQRPAGPLRLAGAALVRGDRGAGVWPAVRLHRPRHGA